MGDALNRFGERLSSFEDSGKKRSERHSHKHRSRKDAADGGKKVMKIETRMIVNLMLESSEE